MATTKQVDEFIKTIAPLVQKYAQERGYHVASPIIAQACLESSYGTSELALNAKNFFGLKYRGTRCPSAAGKYLKIGSEQLPNGTYVSKIMEWYKFNSLEDSVKGYFEFISISNYNNLKEIHDPKQYLETIKADNYASSLNYVEKNFKVVNIHNLTQYDNFSDPKPKAIKVESKPVNNQPKENPVENKENALGLKEGDKIRLRKDATYYTGKKIPAWVFNRPFLFFRGISPNGYIFSTKKTGDITGVVKEEFIIKKGE